MNIYQKMAAITAELQTVAKNLDVETGKGKSYKAVSERDIIDAVKPLEIKHGVYSYPVSRDVVEASMLESESQYGKRTTFFSRIKTTYRFVNVDEPTDFIETITFAEGIDSQDKGSGKAMTYADKYALMKAYKISTGDDPDQTASKDEQYQAKQQYKPNVPAAKLEDYLNQIQSIAHEKGIAPSALEASLQKHFNKGLNGLNADEAKQAIALMKTPAKVTVNEIPG
jgi:hypothetical protein